MGTGLDDFEKAMPQRGGGGGNYIREFFLRADGEKGEGCFLTDGNDLYYDAFHVIDQTPERPRFARHLCKMMTEGACTYCAAGDSPKRMFFAWFYVKNIYHAQPQEKFDTVPVRMNGKTFFVQTVNAPYLWARGFGKDDSMMNMLRSLYQKYGSLTDRDYDIARSGTGIHTIYTLLPGDKRPVPSDLIELAKSLPNLADVASQLVTTMDGKMQDPSLSEKMPLQIVRDREREEEDDIFLPMSNDAATDGFEDNKDLF